MRLPNKPKVLPCLAGPILLGCVLSAQLPAQTIVYGGFNSTEGLTRNGDAEVVTTTNGDGKVMRLAPASPNQAGSIFTETKFNIASFSTIFEFRITGRNGSNNDSSSADGLAFIVQNKVSTALGDTGEFLGYGGSTASKITPSVAVEFDTFFNSGNDPTIANGGSNHVGIDIGGSVVFHADQTAKVTPNMDDGDKWTVWVDYNGSILEVRMSINGLRPTTAILTQTNFDIPALVGSSTGFIGFSASTGGANTNHDLLGWAYSETFLTNGLASVPEPSTTVLLGLGALLVLGGRRLRRAR